MACVYKIKGKTVTLDQLEDFIRDVQEGSFQKVSVDKVTSSILGLHNKVKFNEDEHKYFIDGKEYRPVSTVIDNFKGWAYNRDHSGETAEEAMELGNKVHKYIEGVIKDNGFNDPVLNKEFQTQVKNFINKLKSRGGKLLSEVRVYDKETGIAGTIDLIHVHSDGSVTIYDFKTALETAYKRSRSERGLSAKIYDKDDTFSGGYSKDKRYSMQLRMYSRILERNFPWMNIRNEMIVPIEVRKDSNMENIDSFTMLDPHDIRDYTYFKASENNVFKVFNEEVRYGNAIGKADNSKGIIKAILGEQYEDEESNIERYAERVWERTKNLDSFRNTMNEEIKFTRKDKSGRLEQIKAERRRTNEFNKKHAVPAAIKFFETEESDSVIGSNAFRSTLKRLFAPYNKFRDRDDVKMYVLSDEIKGLQDHSDVLVVEHGGVTDLIVLGTGTNAKYKFNRKSNNIFGNYVSDFKANEMGIHLGNTKADTNLLKLGLILPHLKQIRPDLQIGRLMSVDVYSENSSVKHEQVYTLLPQVKAMLDHKAIKGQLTDELLEIYSGDSLDPDAYRQDYLHTLSTFLESDLASSLSEINNLSKKKAKELRNAIEDYRAEKVSLDKLIETLEDRLQYLLKHFKSMGGKDIKTSVDDMTSNPEFVNLSFALMQLKGVKDLYTLEDINSFREWMDTKEKTGVPMINMLAKMMDNGVNQIRHTFYSKYKNESDIMVRKLMKDYQERYNDAGAIKDRVMSAGMYRYFEPLLEKVPEGDDVRYTMSFHKTGTPEYKALSDVQKEFIEWYSDKIQDGWKMLLGERVYNERVKSGRIVRGEIPIMKASYAQQFFRAKNKLGTKEGTTLYKNALNDYFTRLTDFSNVHMDGDNDPRSIPDSFSNQLDPHERNRLLGRQEDMTYDMEMQNALEMNLEVVMDVFQVNALRKDIMGKVLPYSHAVTAVLKATAENGMIPGENKNLQDMVRKFNQMVVIGGRVQSTNKTERAAENILSNVSHFASIFMLGLNVTTVIVNFMQMAFSSLGASISNRISSDYGNNFFGIGDMTKAVVDSENLTASGHNKLELLTRLYGVSGQDLNALKNRKRQRTTDKSFINSDFFFKLMTAADYSIRAISLKAQMIKDGVWDAHTVKKVNIDGIETWVLEYNEDLDPRFKADPSKGRTLEQALAFKEYLREQLRKEGKVDENGRMLVAYDNNLRNQRKNYFDSIFDAYDTESRTTADSTALGRALMMFKRFMTPKIERFYKKRTVFSGSAYSDYRMIKDNEGNIDFVWEDSPIEGIYQSVQDLLKRTREEIGKIRRGEGDWDSPWGQLEDFQKDNIYKLGTDLALSAMIYMVISAMTGDDDDESKKKNSYVRMVLMRSIEDLTATYNPLMYLQLGASPLVTLSYIERVANSLSSLITNPSTEQADKTAKTTISAYKQITDIYNEFKEKGQ